MVHSDPSSAIASILAPIDRRSAVDRLVAYLVRDSSAVGGAVLTVGHAGLVPYVVRGVEVRRLMTVQDSWTRARDILEAGGIVSGTAHAIIPIVMGESLGGLLFLDAPQAFDARATLPFIDAIGRAMADPIPGEERDAAPVSLEPGGKDELLTALHRSEWNLARAARMCGCSRRTIYLRMERYGIERRKVPKSVRRPVR